MEVHLVSALQYFSSQSLALSAVEYDTTLVILVAGTVQTPAVSG
jgi:hypothetical protein